MATETTKRGNPRRKTGIVVKDKNAKTIIVEISTLVKHRLYKKYIKQTKKCHVHDENDIAKIGDKVTIVETKPKSKLKRWRLVKVLEK